MRTSPSLIYSIHTPRKSNMTLYEMSESMSENSDAQEAFPYLVKWLLKDFWTNYRYNGIPYSEEYAYNIAYFTIYNFINREICNSKPEVFRTKFLKEIVNMNLDSDFYSILKNLKEANVGLTRTITTKDDNENNSTGTTTRDLNMSSDETIDTTGKNVLTHNTTDVSDTTGKSTAESSGTNTSTSGSNNTETLNTKVVVDAEGTSNDTTNNTVNNTTDTTGTSTSRNVLTDYPQSTVDTTVIGSWNYASGANDTNNSNTEKVVNNQTNNGTSSNNTTNDSTTSNTGTVTNEGTANSNTSTTGNSTTDTTGKTTVTKSGDDTTDTTGKNVRKAESSDTGTISFNNNSTDNRSVATTESWDGLTGLELNEHQIEMFNKFKSFYNTLMRRLENCFISIYVDEDRDGYLDPNINLMSAWNS